MENLKKIIINNSNINEKLKSYVEIASKMIINSYPDIYEKLTETLKNITIKYEEYDAHISNSFNMESNVIYINKTQSGDQIPRLLINSLLHSLSTITTDSKKTR